MTDLDLEGLERLRGEYYRRGVCFRHKDGDYIPALLKAAPDLIAAARERDHAPNATRRRIPMSEDLVMGVDPGASGGFAVLELISGRVVEASKWGPTETDFFQQLVAYHDSVMKHAYIEKVHAMPGEGVSSSFKFGYSQGFLTATLIAAGYPFTKVSPAKWQKPYALPRTKDVGRTKKKNAHKARAQELFPDLKITHAIADALLIAEFCRRTA